MPPLIIPGRLNHCNGTPEAAAPDEPPSPAEIQANDDMFMGVCRPTIEALAGKFQPTPMCYARMLMTLAGDFYRAVSLVAKRGGTQGHAAEQQLRALTVREPGRSDANPGPRAQLWRAVQDMVETAEVELAAAGGGDSGGAS